MSGVSRAFWLRSPGVGEIRTAPLPSPGPDEVLVRTRYSGISRGTETLVFRGGVPPSQHALMRAPFQDGEFPAPVKYGYLSVGVVEEGPDPLVGRTVFCLYPHQDRYVVPAGAVTPIPDAVPAGRAMLGGHGRDRRQRAVGRRAAGRRPDRGGRRRDGRLLRRPAADRAPRRTGGAGRRRPGAGDRRGGARRAVPDARRRGGRVRPRRARHRPPRRPHPRARAARRRGRGDRALLVRRPARARPARGGVPLPAAHRAGQPGGGDRGPATRAAHPRRPPGARARPAGRSGVRRTDLRRGARSTTYRPCSPNWRTGRRSALCQRVVYDHDG